MKVDDLAVTALDIRANRFDLLSRLADDLAHEVKNPLHAAVINLELLKRRIGTDDRQSALERVDLLEDEVALVHRLVDTILLLLRPERGAADSVEFDTVVADITPLLEAVAKLNRVCLEVELLGPGQEVAMPAAALRHALLNLIVNALEAMRPNGGHLQLRGQRAGNEVVMRIHDSGPGIPAEVRDRIAERGVTSRPGRAGLGVAVARALVEQGGGRVEIESPGTGESGAVALIAIPCVSRA